MKILKWIGIFVLIIVGSISISLSSPSYPYETANTGGYVFGGFLVILGIFFAAKMIFFKNNQSSPSNVSIPVMPPAERQKVFCTHCGKQIPIDSTFCTHCGQQVGTNPQSPKVVVAQSQSDKFYKNKLTIRKGVLIISYIAVGMVVIGMILAFVSYNNGQTVVSSGQTIGTSSSYCDPSTGINCQATSVNGLIRTVINWLLGIAFGLDTLAIIAGIILGIIYLTKANKEQGELKAYHQRVAIYWILAPIFICVGIILMYVIINVASNLATGS